MRYVMSAQIARVSPHGKLVLLPQRLVAVRIDQQTRRLLAQLNPVNDAPHGGTAA